MEPHLERPCPRNGSHFNRYHHIKLPFGHYPLTKCMFDLRREKGHSYLSLGYSFIPVTDCVLYENRVKNCLRLISLF